MKNHHLLAIAAHKNRARYNVKVETVLFFCIIITLEEIIMEDFEQFFKKQTSKL